MRSELVEICQGSRSLASFEAAVLELMQREIGFDVAFFSTRWEEAHPTVVEIGAATVELAVARGAVYFEELSPVKRAALAAQGVAVDTHVLGLGRVRETSYFRELGRPVGIQHSLMAYVPWQGEVIAAIMLGRRTAFSERDVLRVAPLLPEIGVGRAAFGLAWSSKPLTAAAEPGLLSRLGMRRRERPLASVNTPSGTLVVRDRDGFREMVATEGDSGLVWTRAALSNPGKSGWPYVELLHVAAALAQRRQRALFIGCGGGVALRQFASVYPGINLDVVELEPAVVELARRWYALDAIPRLTVHVADGFEFITQARASTWDIVVIDAYDARQLSDAFVGRSFFRELHRVLCPGGAMAFNVIGTLDGRGPLPRLVRAARTEFAEVRVIPIMVPDEACAPHDLRNLVVVGTTQP